MKAAHKVFQLESDSILVLLKQDPPAWFLVLKALECVTRSCPHAPTFPSFSLAFNFLRVLQAGGTLQWLLERWMSSRQKRWSKVCNVAFRWFRDLLEQAGPGLRGPTLERWEFWRKLGISPCYFTNCFCLVTFSLLGLFLGFLADLIR